MNRERMIFISTHQIRDLENLIDHVIIVDEGKLLLSSSIADIASTLCFKTVDRVPVQNVIYSEPSLHGTSVIIKNSTGEDTRVNLEQLFNAFTENPELTKIFHHQQVAQ